MHGVEITFYKERSMLENVFLAINRHLSEGLIEPVKMLGAKLPGFFCRRSEKLYNLFDKETLHSISISGISLL